MADTPDKVVAVPGVGNISFPGTMSDDEVGAAIKNNMASLNKAKLQTTLQGLRQQNAQNESNNIGGTPPSVLGQVVNAAAESNKQVAGAYLDEAKSIGRTALNALNPLTGSIPGQAYQQAKFGMEHMDQPPTASESLGQVGVDLPGAKQALSQGNVPSAIQKVADPAIQALLAKKAMGALPEAEGIAASKANAQAKLSRVAEVANNNPVDVTGPTEIALQAVQKLKAGGAPATPMTQWIARVRAGAHEMTFQEARDFYENATRKLSPDEMAKTTGPMRMLRAQFAKSLHQALVDSAELSGKGAEYASGISEYHNAMQMRRAGSSIAQTAKQAIPLAAKGAAVAGGGYAGYNILKNILGGP